MANRRKPRSSSSIGKTILNLIILIPTFYSLVGKVLNLMGYEARLAGKTIIKMLFLAIASSIILASTWLCILTLVGTYLVSLGLSYIFAITVIILLNLLILAILMTLAHRSESNLAFRATRQQIHHAFRMFTED